MALPSLVSAALFCACEGKGQLLKLCQSLHGGYVYCEKLGSVIRSFGCNGKMYFKKFWVLKVFWNIFLGKLCVLKYLFTNFQPKGSETREFWTEINCIL